MSKSLRKTRLNSNAGMFSLPSLKTTGPKASYPVHGVLLKSNKEEMIEKEGYRSLWPTLALSDCTMGMG